MFGNAGSSAPSLAARPSLTSYHDWHIGSGIEEFYGPNAGASARARREYFEAAKHPFVIDWFFGTRILIYPDDESCKVIYFTGLFEPNEFLFLSKVFGQGMTFIDVGSSMGLYSIFASSLNGASGRVVAFEPSSRDFERLLKNCQLNKQLNIVPLNLALSDRPGFADLLVAEDNHAGHNTLGSFAYSETKLKQKERVATRSLDGIVEERSIESLDVVKMDVEGSELFALRGSSTVLQRFKPILMVELFDAALEKQGCDASSVAQFLREFGYDLFEFAEAGKLAPYPLKDRSSRNVVGIHGSALANLRARIQIR